MESSKIYIVLPVYNEQANIATLLESIRRSMAEAMPVIEYTAVMVDDGSTDQTLKTAEAAWAVCPVGVKGQMVLLRHDMNSGLAAALRSGLRFCLHEGDDRDIVFVMDGDNSHPADLMPSMARLIGAGDDVVIASRYQIGSRVIGLSWRRRALSWLGNLTLRALFPIPNVRDYTCGYRAYRLGVLQRAYGTTPSFVSATGFSCMADILLRLRMMKPHPAMSEVPLILRYDLKQGASKLSIVRTTWETLRLIARRLPERPPR